MKKLILMIILCSTFLLFSISASAVPLLQLDIAGGTYIGDGTTYGGPSGTLIALLDPSSGEYGTANNKIDVGDTFFISLSVLPSNSSDPGINPIFGLPTTAIDLTSLGGTGGTPINMPPHGVFPTYYWKYSFKFDELNLMNPINVAEDPGDPVPYSGSGSFFYAAEFSYDVSSLLALGSIDEIHFDIFAYDLDGNIHNAPFSKDASAVPLPAAVYLLGAGFVGLAGLRRKFKK